MCIKGVEKSIKEQERLITSLITFFASLLLRARLLLRVMAI